MADDKPAVKPKRTRSFTGRADLLLASDQARLQTASAADALGFSYEYEASGKQHRFANSGDQSLDAETREGNGVEDADQLFNQPAPFWRLTKQIYRPIPDENDREKRKLEKLAPVRWEKPAAPEFQPILSQPQLRLLLKRVLAERATGRRLDTVKLTQRVAKAQPLRRLPTLDRKRSVNTVYLLLDRACRLTPLLKDQEFVVNQLEGPAFNLQVVEIIFSDIALRWPLRELPAPGSVVLAMSDFGLLSFSGARHIANQWIRLGGQLNRGGCRLVALLPVPLSQCSAELRKVWQPVYWGRSGSKAGHALSDHSGRQKLSERLLTLVAFASRVDFELLRALRKLLAAEGASVITEVDAWQHVGLTNKHAMPASWNVQLLLEYQQRFQKLKLPLQVSALEVQRLWRTANWQSLWFTELVAMPMEAVNTSAKLKEDWQAALRWWQRLDHSFEQQGSTVLGVDAQAFIEWSSQRWPDSSYLNSQLGPTLHKLCYQLFGDAAANRPGFSPKPGSDSAARRIVLFQQGRELLVVWQPAEEAHEPSGGYGASKLASLKSAAPILAVDVVRHAVNASSRESSVFPCPVSLSSPAGEYRVPLQNAIVIHVRGDTDTLLLEKAQRPYWADDTGRARNGLWSRVQIEHSADASALYHFDWQIDAEFIEKSPTVKHEWAGRWEMQRGLTPPNWASAIGVDGFGLWAEFTVEAESQIKSQAIIQCMRWIPPGQLLMGSPEAEVGRIDAEGPQHKVTISQGYWAFDTPCTQALWQAVMGDNPSEFKSPDRPVENVNAEDAEKFLTMLNKKIPGLNLSLPTEAQWEYACRAGTQTATWSGDLDSGSDSSPLVLDRIAWHYGNSDNPRGTRQVKQKQANPWGLYDMLGNVWEWCADGWGGYEADESVDPLRGPEAGGSRVIRGGSWLDHARRCRAAYRLHWRASDRNGITGFRPVRVQNVSSGKPDGPAEQGAAEPSRSGVRAPVKSTGRNKQ